MRTTLETAPRERRILFVSLLCLGVALAAGVVAQVLGRAIAVVTNLAFFGRLSSLPASPAEHHLGPWVLAVPVAGGLAVGLLARFGSKAIRGHGIPEAMEQVLTNESRIPARLTFLKPLSAAIAIGTGGPFGAEGPIIATGGALGSLVGQIASVTADERKTLLCAGAAAGMTATFGTPIAAVLLAVELLLFEYRARSLIPVALASVTAAAVRGSLVGTGPVFPMPDLAAPSSPAVLSYALLGAGIGLVAVGITRAVYGVEDLFARLPVHWMWWPAFGGIAVGAVGYVVPRSLGVGYDNIEGIVGGTLVGRALVVLCVGKLVSWLVALGSGTSGGTLAPLFTIGGALGGLTGTALALLFPRLGVDPRVAALVGMAAMFAGASHATLASVVFAFETTRQPLALLPLLAGCAAAYLVSSLTMRTTIMTEKIGRRGLAVSGELGTDPLLHVRVRDVMTQETVMLRASAAVASTRAWLLAGGPEASHGAYPVVDADERPLGILTRRRILDAAADEEATLDALVERPAATVRGGETLRDAADAMLVHGVGRLVVVGDDGVLVGLVGRREVMSAHGRRLDHDRVAPPTLTLRTIFARRGNVEP